MAKTVILSKARDPVSSSSEGAVGDRGDLMRLPRRSYGPPRNDVLSRYNPVLTVIIYTTRYKNHYAKTLNF